MKNNLHPSRARLILAVLSATILILSFIRVAITNRFANEGIELGKLQQQVKQLDTQNMVLQEKVLPMQSYTVIAQKAKQEGFIQK